MPFRCYKCGKCCTTLGRSITIEQITDTGVIGKSAITGEKIHLPQTPSLKEKLAENSVFETYPDACPFLRQETETIWFCLAHAVMPSHCKALECYVMLILHSDGSVVGKIRAKRTLSTEDATLKELYDTVLVFIPAKEDVVWQKEAKKILISKGYKVKM
jgi:Fe-S-cluster containining protein